MSSSTLSHPIDFTFAYQPIVNAETRTVISYEALVRGRDNTSAAAVFASIADEDRFAFDRNCRSRAIALATRLGLACDLNLNFLPQSLLSAEVSIAATVDAAVAFGLPLHQVVLEFTEGEAITESEAFARFTNEYRALGLKLAMDDFGAGYSGFNLLADFQPDQLKLDRQLIRGIESRGARQAIVRATLQVCGDLGIDLIAEGVETLDEYNWLRDHGVTLFQGYLFARPGFEYLPLPSFPAASESAVSQPAVTPFAPAASAGLTSTPKQRTSRQLTPATA